MYAYSYIDILKSRFVEFLDSFICNESVLWKIINVTLVIYSCSNVSTRHLFIYHSIAIRPFGYGNRARTALEATVSWLTNQDCVDTRWILVLISYFSDQFVELMMNERWIFSFSFARLRKDDGFSSRKFGRRSGLSFTLHSPMSVLKGGALDFSPW